MWATIIIQFLTERLSKQANEPANLARKEKKINKKLNTPFHTFVRAAFVVCVVFESFTSLWLMENCSNQCECLCVCEFGFKNTASCSRFNPYINKCTHRLQLWLNGIFNLVYTDTDSIDRQTQLKNIKREKNKTQIGLQSRINRYFKINLLETCACIFICTDWYCLGNIIHTLFIAGQEITMRAYFVW